MIDTLQIMSHWAGDRLVLYTGLPAWSPRSYANPLGINLGQALVGAGLRTKLWWAAYTAHCPRDCWQWQYTGSGKVDGITDNAGLPTFVDLNVRFEPHMFVPGEPNIDVRQIVGASP